MRKSFVVVGVLGLLNILGSTSSHAEDMEQLAPLSLRYLKELVPEDKPDSPPELFEFYETYMQYNANRSSGRPADQALNDRLTRRIRQLLAGSEGHPAIDKQVLRDELMMWYAPSVYLSSIRSARHRDILQNFSGRAPTLSMLIGHDNYVRNIHSMDRAGLRSAQLAEEGWSETFWPDLAGSIAAPYADPTIQLNFLNHLFYRMNRGFLDDRAAIQQRIATGGFLATDTDRLSAAEKYDLLVGDLNFTFTNRVLQMVDQISDDNSMAIWSGVCDGWSSASLNFFRPQQSVVVTGARGHRLRFYPTDIKGLASFLWGKSFDRAGLNHSQGVGYQCKDRRRDFNGRLVDPRCNDVNSGLFHIAAVNTIGVDRHGFVFDRSDESKVMNQPAYGYEYKYFNPRTLGETRNLNRAKARKGTWVDPFYRYRSERMASVVGVKMTVRFKKEHGTPRARATDGLSDDRNEAVELKYDLELDAQGNVIGGEWWHYDDVSRPSFRDSLTDNHPDTMWLVIPGIRMYSSVMEYNYPEWQDGAEIPSGLLAPAREAASAMKAPFGPTDRIQHDVFRPMPLEKVVSGLVRRSRPGHTQHEISRIPGRYRQSFPWLSDAEWANPPTP